MPFTSVGLSSLSSSSRSRKQAPHRCRSLSRSTSAPMTTLFSFDVDGTLIHSLAEKSNWLHKQAFKHCFKEVFDLDTNIDVIPHHGGTDPLIIKAVLEHHGVSPEEAMAKLPALKDSMIRFAQRNEDKAAEGLEALPGVPEFLRYLKNRPNTLTCLVTGNLEPIAWLKMSHLGLLDCFTEPQFGGFGTDFCSGNSAEMWRDRAVFVKIAGEKAQKIAAARGMPAVTKRIHVGDTPYDIQAAVEAGAFALGVTTGIFDKAKLESYMDVSKGQGVVVSGLQDIETVIKACGEAV